MVNQDANFLSTNPNFSIQSSSTVGDEVADLIFGGGTPAANPRDVKPLVKKIVEDEPVESPEPEKVEVTADDLLNDLAAIDPKAPKTDPEPAKPKKEVLPTDTNPVAEPSEEDASTTFSTLSKNLVDLGIFTQDEAEVLPKTAEEFKDKWIAERQEQVNTDIYNFLVSKHGEEGLKVFEDIFVKGVDPKEYYSKYTDIQSLKGLDLTVEANQEKVVRESLRRQGFKDEQIDKKVQKLKDYGDLEEEAPVAHELLLRQEEGNLQAIAAQKEQEAQAKAAERAAYSNSLQTILSEKLKTKEFDGIPVTDKVAREVYDMLNTEKWQLPSGEKLTDFDKEILELRNPANVELKIKLALLLRNRLDLSKLKMNLVSKETNKIFEDLVIKDKQVKRTKPVSAGMSFFDGLNK